MIRIWVYEYVTAQRAIRSESDRIARPLLAQGNAMLQAIVTDFRRLPECTVWTNYEAIPGLTVESNSLLEPNEPEWLDARFQMRASQADWTLLIAPEFESILEIYARSVLQHRGKLLGCDSESIHLTSDKLLCFKHLQSHGMATPQCWEWGLEPEFFPMVWKPRAGAGSLFSFLIHDSKNRLEAKRILELESNNLPMIAQEYVSGIPVSVAFLVQSGKTIPLQPCTQKISQDGRFRYEGGSTPIETSLAQRAIAAAQPAVESIPGLSGYVGVDLVLGEKDWIIEINPRISTSYVGLQKLAKTNLAEIMLRMAQHETLPELKWLPGKVDFTPQGECEYYPA